MKSLSKVIKSRQLTISAPKLLKVEPPLQRPLPEEPEPVQARDVTAEPADLALADETTGSAESAATAEQIDPAAQMEELEQKLQARRQAVEQEIQGQLRQTEAECAARREDAEAQIAQMKEQARHECAAIQSAARDEAYQEGLRQAQQEIENDRQMAMEQIRLLTEDAHKKFRDIIARAEPEIVELSMAVAKKVIAAELTSRPELIVDIVREAIDHLDNPTSVRIQVNPKDDLYLSGDGQTAFSQFGSAAITLQPDEAVARGGCVLESNMAVVDSRLETRIANMDHTLREVLLNE
jgi:flagellar biosynthesis/type III secretory pathway protein FliH